MNSKILFLASFPDDANIREGMMSRVYAIDRFFIDIKRVYLNISSRKNRKRRVIIDDKLSIYELNLFFHFFLILKIIYSSKVVYSHSIHMSKLVMPFLLLYRGSYILDAHGVVPEEIKYFSKRLIRSYFYNLIEKLIFYKAKYVICVSNSMQKYFSKKYPRYNQNFLVYNIIPETLKKSNHKFEIKKESKVEVLYSGGAAGWQNIDLMLKTISDNICKNINYTILTGDISSFKKAFEKYYIDESKITLKSVDPKELHDYYVQADYAFILRDNNVVNNVANPTKLMEYLYYGIIPIVLSRKIGDYDDYNFQTISVDEFDVNIPKPAQRSEKNIHIAEKIIESNKKINIKDIILGF